jgi:hypothetical protein
VVCAFGDSVACLLTRSLSRVPYIGHRASHVTGGCETSSVRAPEQYAQLHRLDSKRPYADTRGRSPNVPNAS